MHNKTPSTAASPNPKFLVPQFAFSIAKALSSGIMGDPQKSQPSATAADLTSSQDDPQGKLQDMEESLGNVIEKTQKFELQTSILEPLRASSGIPVQPGSPRLTMASSDAELTTVQYRALTKLSEVLSAQLSAQQSAQLSAQLDSQKSILEELRLIRASNAINFQSERKKTPNFTVPDREPFNPYPRVPGFPTTPNYTSFYKTVIMTL
ncbi:unnamed protein product [Prunus brigantina]